MSNFPANFLWGASTSPHQTEGDNVHSDWWAREGLIPGMEPSGKAVDSYHRYREDMTLLADAGLNAYRFGIEWARVEPRAGQTSHAELAHYRDMIDTALELGLTPVVTLHHFSSPRWFAEQGGWTAPDAVDRFVHYVQTVSDILEDVPWVATINEPNMLAMMIMMEEAFRTGQIGQWQSPTVEGEPPGEDRPAALPTPDRRFALPLIEAHHAARDVLRSRTNARVGWTVANQAFTAAPGGETRLEEVRYDWEDFYLNATAGDDFIGVQAYSSQQVDQDGVVPHPPHPDNTLVGTAYRPDALSIAVRHTWGRTGLPILVTENGIATADDSRRIAYTSDALSHLDQAIGDGVDVRGYLHWSLLDNYEWGHWGPTFGLVAVDRKTFQRTPKPSLAWLGSCAAANSAVPAPHLS
ncbi:glycoside hydrolase family 1 protein [Microbacterium rhizomatis]|uniref:Glycoside hydrolase family 1 protein n=1 Tax=Microbacterium rhizomatis TaxID=1631477 RepID=A0A5J5J196_9MICO|nr:family 1 glycosylhydrolase [Microbacterium rhizomatis]KAA9105867.1 glycoside hydrolase family 1 protein [Microbacterium rhizomatis]